MEHARKKIRKKKENKIIIRREYKDTEEYKIRQQFLKNYYRPAFDSAEPKFKDFGSKDDSNIGVGSYNLIYPRKKIGQNIIEGIKWRMLLFTRCKWFRENNLF